MIDRIDPMDGVRSLVFRGFSVSEPPTLRTHWRFTV